MRSKGDPGKPEKDDRAPWEEPEEKPEEPTEEPEKTPEEKEGAADADIKIINMNNIFFILRIIFPIPP